MIVDFANWLADKFAELPPGKSLEYWRGSAPGESVSMYAQSQYDSGHAELVQRRNGDGTLSYLMIKRAMVAVRAKKFSDPEPTHQ